MGFLMKTPSEGADTILYAVTSNEEKLSKGGHYLENSAVSYYLNCEQRGLSFAVLVIIVGKRRKFNFERLEIYLTSCVDLLYPLFRIDQLNYF